MLHRFVLSSHADNLGVGDQEDMAIHVARAGGLPLNFQLDAVGGVHKPRAAAVHRLVDHGAQVDQQPEPVFGVELLQCPHVLAFHAFVIQHVWRAVDGDADFGDVGERCIFPSPGRLRHRAPRRAIGSLSGTISEYRL